MKQRALSSWNNKIFFPQGISPTVTRHFGVLSLLLLLVDSHYRVLNIVRDVVTVGLRPLQTIARHRLPLLAG